MKNINPVKTLWPGKSFMVEEGKYYWPPTEAGGEFIPFSADEMAKVEVELGKLQKEWDSLEYSRRRAREYDALNQFELMTDDAANSTTTHADAISAVKAKWPKDNSGPVE